MAKRLGRKKFSSYAYDLVVNTFCIIFGLISIYPLWYIFLGSLSRPGTTAALGFKILLPLDPYFGYYISILQGPLFQRAMLISISTTAIGAFGGVVLTGMMAYGVSKKKVKFMKFSNTFMVLTMFFGGGLIPTFLLINKLHLYDTYMVLIVFHLMQVFYFILMRNYFTYAIPSELEDAAVVDGTNDLVLFFKIIVPISMPLFATIFLFTAVGIWNDWYTYLIYANRVELQPFIVVLQKLLINPNQYLGAQGSMLNYKLNLTATGLKMTTIMIAILPILMLYPFLQKYFTKGMMIGAVKG
ncbi:carbohydrate ABC transporter permease [Paenibacillus eucommiae]|uniref:ABC-type glycerol-3-phosphate transport system permease component n=1 Tax=Paenibacillus eucommiae TaxID=1355755 RepID=A0ABS4ITD6_9BACL|nr:carbohydrate ABC transporter permease [Paenibacillus eucommiae]MBP1990832.1 ABC-type glycerol-3-phosphate transport system permease component [Paenibacillus eucommiae]